MAKQAAGKPPRGLAAELSLAFTRRSCTEAVREQHTKGTGPKAPRGPASIPCREGVEAGPIKGRACNNRSPPEPNTSPGISSLPMVPVTGGNSAPPAV